MATQNTGKKLNIYFSCIMCTLTFGPENLRGNAYYTLILIVNERNEIDKIKRNVKRQSLT